MRKNRLSFNEAKRIPITDYLSSLGFEPARIRGIDYWYHSPFREERTPSFKVNSRLNVWFDHGTGEGGTILDLGARLNGCTLQEFIEMLPTGNQMQDSIQRHQFSLEKRERKLEVISASDLTNADLIQYLSSRCIDPETARTYCKQIEFRIEPKVYTAVGFENQSGGYELRNRWFKGSSSPKDISLIKRGSSKICVLEGFMDFLSVLGLGESEIKKLAEDSDFLILNSLRLLNRSLPIIQSHREINLFLDNDLAAKEAKDRLSEKGMPFCDRSFLFEKYKDVNDYLIACKRNTKGQGFPKESTGRVKR